MFFGTRQAPSVVVTTPVAPRQIGLINTLALQEIWRTKMRSVGGYDLATILNTQQGLLAGSSGEIALLNHQTGQTIWKNDVWGKAWRKAQIRSLTADETTAYVWNGLSLTAYRLDDGQEIWQTPEYSDGRGGWYPYLRYGTLFLYTYTFAVPGSLGEFYLLEFDPQSGKLRNRQDIPVAPSEPYFYYPLESIYFREGNRRLFATDWQTDQTLWDIHKKYGESVKTPYVYEDEIILMSKGDNDYRLLAIEQYSGKIRWRIDDVLSNAVVIDETVYVIYQDLTIQGYDIKTAELIGQTEIVPSISGYTHHNFVLAAHPNDGLLHVYYPDSEEIITFSSDHQ